MKLDLNKDFEKAYPQTYWKGMSMEELVTIGLFLPVVLGVAGLLWYYQKIPLQIGVYLGILQDFRLHFWGCLNIRECLCGSFIKNGATVKKRENFAEKIRQKEYGKNSRSFL